MREAAEMSNPTSEYFAAPLEDNLFEWHFTVRGPEDTDFQVKLLLKFLLDLKFTIRLYIRVVYIMGVS